MLKEREIMPDDVWGKKIEDVTKTDIVGWMKQLMECEAAMNATDSPGDLVYISHHVCDEYKSKYSFVEAQVNLGNLRLAVEDGRVKTADGTVRTKEDLQNIYNDVFQAVKIQNELEKRMVDNMEQEKGNFRGRRPE